jgi:hypothetical protein
MQIARMPRLHRLLITGAVTDEGLRPLVHMERLDYLYLNSNAVTDQIWETLVAIPNLDYLDIDDCALLTGRGIERLAASAKLSGLELRFPQNNDDVLRAVARIRSLRTLIIRRAPITDAGLLHLKNSNLKKIELHGSRVTAEGVAELKRFLPACEITNEF